jgi:uncharacterized membrane protein
MPARETAETKCAACRELDMADGVLDGNLFPALTDRVSHERHTVHRLKEKQDHLADRITEFAGSLKFVYIHAVWFAVWIIVNVGVFGQRDEFDRFPFGLLTMIVSLEAIFLSTFVMVSQNRQAARSDVRSELDFEANLRSEIWSVHIGEALGIDTGHVERVVRETIDAARSQLGVGLALPPLGAPEADRT